jgi:hypothetical protein
MSEGGKRSAWMVHVKKTMKAHKGMKLGQVLKMAAKTYKKGMKGGAEDVAPYGEARAEAEVGASEAAPVGGRRKSRKTRRGGRKSKKTRKH